jgi:hypothetical protein
MSATSRAITAGCVAIAGGLTTFILSGGPTTLAAQAPAPARPATNVPDFTGGYVRIDETGSGSYGGLTAKFTRAELTPAAAAAAPARGVGGAEVNDDVPLPDKPNPPGVPYQVTAGRCGGPGAAIEFNSAAFFLIQGRNEIVIAREGAGARRIWMDGRPKPDASRWVPTAAGFSNGRYDNGDLVIETTGLTEATVTAGGRRTPDTRLTERFHLDGKKLTITYTWDDPKIYVKPHRYSMSFDRLPATDYAFEGWCDGSDPASGQGITPPVQIQGK